MNLGVFDMIGLAASLVFAIPLANYAVVQLFAGQTALGAGLLVVAVAMVVLPQYFLDPGRILAGLARGLLPRQLRGDRPADDAAAGGSSSDDAAAGGSSSDDAAAGGSSSDDAAAGEYSGVDDAPPGTDVTDVADAIDEAESADK